MKLKVIDLFCGAGGFSEGFRQVGFKIILGIDSWEDAINSFKANQRCNGWIEDIREVTTLPECDVIIGSPPCQCFSYANSRKSLVGTSILHEKGLELVHEFERIIKINKPKYWIWENVETVKKFYPQAFTINAFDVGVPQKRRRAFIANFSFFRQSYKRGGLPPAYGYNGAKVENKGRAASYHRGQAKTVTGKSIRNLKTGELLSMEKVRELMGFPRDYFLYGGITSQKKQLGNAVCPPVAKMIAEGLKTQI